MRTIAMTAVVTMTILSAGTRASAQSAQCAVTEIVATNDKQGFDPRLERLRGKLSKPPFSAWDTFRLMGDSAAPAEKSRPTAVKLASGGTMTLVFKDKLVTQGGKPRLRFGIDKDSKEGKRTLSTVVVFDSGDAILFSGEPYGNGTYILALSCTSP